MLMIGLSLLSRSCKWCNATTVSRCCSPLINSLVLHPTGGRLTWKPMRNPRASTGQNSELLSVHIMCPQGVVKLKKKEFQVLKQGSMSVNEYVTKFTQLSCYAPDEVDTDEKKNDCFLNGLNDGLAYALEARDFENFQGMVSKALLLENPRDVMDHKSKLVC
jgi:hypothetical protein